jgi:hypothetical protein
MENLAGKNSCDKTIRQELEDCLITPVDTGRRQGEVPSRFTGVLGPYRFRRAWRYYVMEGPVPMTVAEELYADPIGKKEVRVAGHCACPPPEEPWTGVYDPWTLKQIFRREDYWKQLKTELGEDDVEDWKKRAESYFILVDGDPEDYGVRGVCLYHIDSMAGLRLFADTIRKHKLHTPRGLALCCGDCCGTSPRERSSGMKAYKAGS